MTTGDQAIDDENSFSNKRSCIGITAAKIVIGHQSGVFDIRQADDLVSIQYAAAGVGLSSNGLNHSGYKNSPATAHPMLNLIGQNGTSGDTPWQGCGHD